MSAAAQSGAVSAPAPSQGWSLVFALSCIVLLLAALGQRLTATLNHDSAWYLDATSRWLDGAVLYRDIMEVNPPLAFFLTAPALWLAEASGLSPVVAFVVYVFALIALSLSLVVLLLGDAAVGSARPRRRLLLLGGFCALAVVPAGDFGQREHLMVVLVLPYIVLVGGRPAGDACAAGLAIVIGCLAGLGLCLKPHFFLLPIGLELYLLMRTRSLARLFRAETLALGATVAAYGLTVVLATPDYLTRILPIAFEVYEGAYRTPLGAFLWSSRGWLILLALSLLLYRLLRPQLQRRGFADAACVAALCFFAIFCVQMKGWSYQFYPVLAALTLLAAACLGEEGAGERAAGLGLRRIAVSVLILTLVIGETVLARSGPRYALAHQLAPILRDEAAGEAIYVFASNVSASYPMVTYSGVRSASRYPAHWLLPGLLRARAASGDSPRLRDVERFLRDSVVEDLMRDPPALVLVDDRPQKSYFGGIDFDYLDYFLADPRFAEIWSGYEKLTRIGGIDVFRRSAGEETRPRPPVGARS
ncbi:MAG: hypothetical protein MI920_23305 [Kiloniellales bacterium]|nr:hypothetical protein [Kiloniellales bacterium]